MSVKNWRLPKENRKLAQILAEECEISQMTAEILVNRNITTFAQADVFLNSDLIPEAVSYTHLDVYKRQAF